MSTDRDTTRIVRSWLRTDEHESADRVLDAVLDRLDTTPQRRFTWWPARRFPEMNKTIVTTGLAAAALAAIVVIGMQFLPAGNAGGNVPSVQATPTPSASPIRYTHFIGEPFPVRIALARPNTWSTWTTEETAAGVLVNNGQSFGSGWGLFFFTFTDNLFADPCDVAPGKLAPIPGPTVEDLVDALSALPRMEASNPIDIEIDGYRGVQIDLTAPADTASCPDGAATVHDVPGWEDVPYRMSLGETLQFRILDVDGLRLVIVATDYPQTSHHEVDGGMAIDPDAHAEDQVELRAMIETMDINP
jgi:hypothetical protein